MSNEPLTTRLHFMIQRLVAIDPGEAIVISGKDPFIYIDKLTAIRADVVIVGYVGAVAAEHKRLREALLDFVDGEEGHAGPQVLTLHSRKLRGLIDRLLPEEG
jgi:hypothetical protein